MEGLTKFKITTAMKTLKVNDKILVNGLERTITKIRWSEKNKGELIEKDEVLYPALCWCVIDTDKGERLRLDYNTTTFELVIRSLTLNGLSIESNQYNGRFNTYYYIANKMGQTYHHKDNKWRKRELKEMTTYAFYSPESALRTFNLLK